MQKLIVTLPEKPVSQYPILIEEGLLNSIGARIKKDYPASRYAIITDSNLYSLYGDRLKSLLEKADLPFELLWFQAGEKNKTRQTKEYLEDQLFEKGFGRDCMIVAFGGGVVGDVAGFVASTFNRGVPFIQVPTTLIAVSDSSVGGKTGIDVPYGKNLLGAFHQPAAVLIDPSLLLTLSDMDYSQGLAEIVKHAVIQDAELFTYLEKNVQAILNRDLAVLEYLIYRNCNIKRQVVEADEKESNLRQILNFGHTMGHAVENLSNYTLPHGMAVAIGMAVESLFAVQLGLLSVEDRDRLISLLVTFNLPVMVPGDMSKTDLIDLTARDKKAREGKARYVLPKSIGIMDCENGQYSRIVPEEIIKEALITS